MMRVRPYPAAAMGQWNPFAPPGPTGAPRPSGPTGIPQLDAFMQTPIGKAVTVGTIATAASTVFPSRRILPFVVGTILAFVTGVVQDVK